MSVERLLVAVNDTPAALHAARAAVRLAAALHARVRFIHVVGDGELVRRLATLRRDGTLDERRASASASLLAHVLARAQELVEFARRHGFGRDEVIQMIETLP